MFDRCMDFTEAWEGGWSDHPLDPGGLTKWGVTLATVVSLALDFNRDGRLDRRDLEAMTREEARAVYRRSYWDKTRCGELPPAVALLVFEAAVNQGPARAARFLQQAAGTTVDGAIGPKTLATVRAAYARDAESFLRDLAVTRALHYSSLANMATFGRGWFRRLFAAHLEAQRIAGAAA